MLSEASIKETELDHPIGRTAHDRAYQRSSPKPISLRFFLKLKAKRGDQFIDKENN